jgi:hypothetical protein
MTCPAENWEFAPPQGQMGAVCDAPGPAAPPCAGVTSAIIENTGQFPLAYTAESTWSGAGYPPGIAFGGPNELAGVLDLGGQADITSVYVGGIVAVLGSRAPFSYLDASKYVGDEGTIPWPNGVTGSEGSSTMYVAEIEVMTSCKKPLVEW